MINDLQLQLGRKLIRYGILLFLLGLITGFLIPAMQNPRMGLSSHLEGTLNGMLLILFGLIWTKLRLSNSVLKWGYGLSLFGTFTNWGTTFLAGIWGAGSEMMPFAGNDSTGLFWQELVIKFGLISLSIAMLAVCGILLWGMRGNAAEN
ncbi:MAG: hydrogenase [Bacteroidetes bacterium]|nr:hydrogenase [Bacteroidota bacterium]